MNNNINLFRIKIFLLNDFQFYNKYPLVNKVFTYTNLFRIQFHS